MSLPARRKPNQTQPTTKSKHFVVVIIVDNYIRVAGSPTENLSLSQRYNKYCTCTRYTVFLALALALPNAQTPPPTNASNRIYPGSLSTLHPSKKAHQIQVIEKTHVQKSSLSGSLSDTKTGASCHPGFYLVQSCLQNPGPQPQLLGNSPSGSTGHDSIGFSDCETIWYLYQELLYQAQFSIFYFLFSTFYFLFSTFYYGLWSGMLFYRWMHL